MGRIADPLVRRFAARYLPRLKRRYRPTLVLAFGSRARGEALAESDLDLLVVSERFRGAPFVERASTLLADLDLALPADVLCCTPEEDESVRHMRDHSQAVEALTRWIPNLDVYAEGPYIGYASPTLARK